MITPRAGLIVAYCLAEADVAEIIRSRAARTEAFRGGANGNPVNVGAVYPLLITQDWGATEPGHSVNGQVLLDGPDGLWVSSRQQQVGFGDEDPEPGRWREYPSD